MLQQVLVLALDDFEPADAAADVDADALGVLFGDLQPGGRKRVVSIAAMRHLDEAAHLLDFFLLDELRGIEMLDLAGDLAVERRRCRRIQCARCRCGTSSSAFQVCSVVSPIAVSRPTPVTTTLRGIIVLL